MDQARLAQVCRLEAAAEVRSPRDRTSPTSPVMSVSCSQKQTFPEGHLCRSDRAAMISGLPVEADSFRVHQHVSNVPTADSWALWQPIGQAYILPGASYCSDDRWTIWRPPFIALRLLT